MTTQRNPTTTAYIDDPASRSLACLFISRLPADLLEDHLAGFPAALAVATHYAEGHPKTTAKDLAQAHSSVTRQLDAIPHPWEGDDRETSILGVIQQRLLEGRGAWSRQGSIYSDRMARHLTTQALCDVTEPTFTPDMLTTVADTVAETLAWNTGADAAWGDNNDHPRKTQDQERAWQTPLLEAVQAHSDSTTGIDHDIDLPLPNPQPSPVA